MKSTMSYLDIHVAIYTYLNGHWTYGLFPKITFIGNIPIIVIRKMISFLMFFY